MWTHQGACAVPLRVGFRGTLLVAGLRRLADPKTSRASLFSLFLGTVFAARDGSVAWFAVTVTGILALEIAKNASGEIYDFAAGSAVKAEERTPISGGKRVPVT
jgi:1,4-dihydroxy-2-naphthoate octaprenyltransferase